MIHQGKCLTLNCSGGQIRIVCTFVSQTISNQHALVRMLASPIRKCVVTDRYLPSGQLLSSGPPTQPLIFIIDFLIRIGPMRMPPDLHTKSKNNNRESPEATLIPDGLQHPKFTARKAERAGYIVCNREAVPLLIERAAYRRVGRYTSVHALFAEHIVHLLRLRVLQELELLGDRMESLLGKPGAVYNSRLIRRLTRHEWKSIRATGVIPYPNAIAVLIVSPLNRDPVSKTRPKGSMSAAPLIEPEQPAPVNPPLPLSTLHPTTAHETVNDNTLPQARIPLYNGVPLFPARAQRAALYNLLIRLLDIERRSRHRTSPSPKMPEKVDDQDKKGSHAFLLCSDAEISRRADVAAVGIALWRVRMFEGGGWDDTSEGSNGWVNILTGS